MKKVVKYGGYLLYAALVAGLLLYVRFPSVAIESFLVQAADRMDPQILFKTASFDPSFPPGIRLKKPSFSLKERPQTALFEADLLSVTPGLGSFLTGEPELSFDAKAYGGALYGQVLFGPNREPKDFSLSLEDVRIQEYGYLPSLGIGDLSGILSGDLRYEGSLDRIVMGNGQGKFLLREGKIDLSKPFLGLQTLPFGELKARFSLKKGTITLSSVSLDGRGFQGSLSGTIYLNRITDRSRLNLKGTIEPIPEYLETLKGGQALLSILGGGRNGKKRSFVVQGTFRSPKFRFI